MDGPFKYPGRKTYHCSVRVLKLISARACVCVQACIVCPAGLPVVRVDATPSSAG